MFTAIRKSLLTQPRRSFIYNYWRAKRDPKAAEEIKNEISSIPLDIKLVEITKLFLNDCSRAYSKVKRSLKTFPRLKFYHGDCTMVYTFDGSEFSLNQWSVASDRGGKSWAKVELSGNKRWLSFSGYLDGGYKFDLSEAISNKKTCEPLKVKGFVALMSKADRMPFSIAQIGNPDHRFTWSQYTHIGIRLRGDGRRYTLLLNTPSYLAEFANDVLSYPLYTRGGPYWQDVLIPFAKLIDGTRGRVKSFQSENKPINSITGVTISLIDNIQGPFKLEIECIYVLKDELIDLEKNAYESYKVPSGVAIK